MGYSVNILPLAGQLSHYHGVSSAAKAILRLGPLGLFKKVTGPEEEEAVPGLLRAANWYGDFGMLADHVMDAVGSGYED